MFRTAVAFAAIVAASILMGTGCNKNQQQQEKPKSPATVEAPRPAEPSPTPTGIILPNVPMPTPVIAAPKTGSPEADDSADARVAGLFPKTGEAGEWKRIEKSALFGRGDLGEVDKPNSEAAFSAYHVDWAAKTAYQLGDDKLIVQLFHCEKPADAYGLLTMRSDQASTAKLGSDVEVRNGEPAQLHICKGSDVLSLRPVSARQPSAEFAAAQAKLAQQILAKLPTGPIAKPELVALLPPRKIIDSKIRLYRGDEFLSGHNSEFSKVARLESDDELAVADYQLAADQSPVTMFVARYSSETKAKDAYDRLHKSELNPSSNGFAVNLLVGGLKGSYVYGSLTGEAYGLMERAVGDDAADAPVMPTIQSKLP